jgi:hypothetical protein
MLLVGPDPTGLMRRFERAPAVIGRLSAVRPASGLADQAFQPPGLTRATRLQSAQKNRFAGIKGFCEQSGRAAGEATRFL